MSFGDRLKIARETKNLSQEQLANMLGVTDGTISNYEKGVAYPRWDTVKKLCDIMDVDPNYLFWDDLSETIKTKILKQNNITKYNSLTTIAQQKVDEYINDLLENPRYIKTEASAFKKIKPIEEDYEIAAWGADGTKGTYIPPEEEVT